MNRINIPKIYHKNYLPTTRVLFDSRHFEPDRTIPNDTIYPMVFPPINDSELIYQLEFADMRMETLMQIAERINVKYSHKIIIENIIARMKRQMETIHDFECYPEGVSSGIFVLVKKHIDSVRERGFTEYDLQKFSIALASYFYVSMDEQQRQMFRLLKSNY